MKIFALTLGILSFASIVFAFPKTNLQFTCPNKKTNSTIAVALVWNAASSTWAGSLTESTAKGVVRRVDDLAALFDGYRNRMEISHKGVMVGFMTQIKNDTSILSDDRTVLNCTF